MCTGYRCATACDKAYADHRERRCGKLRSRPAASLLPMAACSLTVITWSGPTSTILIGSLFDSGSLYAVLQPDRVRPIKQS